MKKYFRNPVLFILLTGAVILLGSNVCCTGNASRNEETKKSSGTTKSTPAKETSGIITLTDDSFDSKTSTGLVLVDFWATWCRPCRMQSPIVESISEKMSGKVIVGKLDVDQNPAISNRFQVESIPTLILFKNGKPVEQFVGLTDEETLTSTIQKHIK